MIGRRPLRRAAARVRFGSLRRTEPLSAWGSSRGKPIDRWYIERFLAGHTDLVCGHALEVKSDQYATRFGAGSIDVVDIDADNASATIVGDLCRPGLLPSSSYDIAIITQTLQLVEAPVTAMQQILRALRPGGSLLLTVPTMSRLVSEADRWRWTPSGMREALAAAAPAHAEIRTVGLGNGLAARAFLFGLAVEDLDRNVLARDDPHYPLIVGGLVRVTRDHRVAE